MNPLISVDEIKKNSQNIILVDCRFDLLSPNKGKQDFETGHIPGSFFANLENLCHDNSLISDGRHPLPHKKKNLLIF